MNTLLTRDQITSPTCLFFTSETDLNKLNIRNISNCQKRMMLANSTLAKRDAMKADLERSFNVKINFTEFNDALSIRVTGDADWLHLIEALRTYNKDIELGKQYDGYQTFYYYGKAKH